MTHGSIDERSRSMLVGEWTVTCLTDVVVPFGDELLVQPDLGADGSRFGGAGFVTINAFLVQSVGHTVLIDTGCARSWRSSQAGDTTPSR